MQSPADLSWMALGGWVARSGRSANGRPTASSRSRLRQNERRATRYRTAAGVETRLDAAH